MIDLKEAINRWVEEILPSEKQFLKAASQKKLTIYHGVDPTGKDLHLGHSTNYLLMRSFQDAGHKIILLIGNFTAKIGDPSDKTAARKRLTDTQIKNNLKTYKEQVSKILIFNGKNPAELKFNSHWLSDITFKELIELAAEFTVQRILERDIFKRRLKEKKPLYLHELLYPLAQGYDSVAMKVDAEIGGTDQTFNMLVGRTLVKKHLNKEKYTISTPLLINPKTGIKAMHKSLGNYIGINDSANLMFGKTMSLPDEMIIPCMRMCTVIPLNDIDSINSELKDGKINPMHAKIKLAEELVRFYHSENDALKAKSDFKKSFQNKTPVYDNVIKYKKSLADIVSSLVGSKSEAKRLIIQGGVDIDGNNVKDIHHSLKGGEKIKIGKKIFVKVLNK